MRERKIEVGQEDYIEEQKFLDRSLEVIDRLMAERSDSYDMNRSEMQKMSKYLWDDKAEMDEVEVANQRFMINTKGSNTQHDVDVYRALKKAKEEPFFGKMKIHFLDEDEEETFYIGNLSIMDNYDLIISDWRSSIASMYYNALYGEKTGYHCSLGFVECLLKQRRQIKIEEGKVTRIVETDTHITDDELQEALRESSTDKMREITHTIQKEQNTVIRNTKDRRIIVQGCAGSGKTSVALHRIAYLLYNDTNLKSKNVLIFSPSDAFSSYISNVLPDLNEDNVLQTTFSDFAKAFVASFKKLESYTDFVSRHYDGLNSEEEERINRFKFSEEYKKALDKFIKRMSNEYRFRDDFSYRELTVPQSFMNKLLLAEENLPLQEKIDAITEGVFSLYKNKDEINRNVLRNKIERELVLPAFNPRIMYNKFVESEEYIQAFGKKGSKLNKDFLSYPDLIGLLYLNFEMIGYPTNNRIHLLVIDEVQDYAPLQMTMIAKMFRGAAVTALGDANQTINPYHKYESLEEMKRVIGVDTKYFELDKAYRSSPEIMNYTNEVLNDTKVIAARTSQNIPVTKKEVPKSDLFSELVKDIIALQESGFKRICIITKGSKESRAIYEGLKDYIEDLTVLDSEEIKSRTLVAPSYLAKGLEFDAVISYNDINNPYQEEDKYLYYVACTRAQHNLVVYNEPKALKKVR